MLNLFCDIKQGYRVVAHTWVFRGQCLARKLIGAIGWAVPAQNRHAKGNNIVPVSQLLAHLPVF